jgi:hypothetical protein
MISSARLASKLPHCYELIESVYLELLQLLLAVVSVNVERV